MIMPCGYELFEYSQPEIRTTSFYVDIYEKLMKENGVNDNCRQAVQVWNAVADKLKEVVTCQE